AARPAAPADARSGAAFAHRRRRRRGAAPPGGSDPRDGAARLSGPRHGFARPQTSLNAASPV
ncbi:hypothetical protein HMPREF0731_3586, partial [Pseudoroseomonas cervicalis ATCC 49957]